MPKEMSPDDGDYAVNHGDESYEPGDDTCEVPVSLIGDAQPGDSVTIQVVSRDENGMATVTSAAEKEPAKGSDSMAAEFDEPQPD